MALVDPPACGPAGREQYHEIIVIPDVSLGYVRGMRLEEQSNTSVTIGEFDPGSGRTLAACLTHASHGG